MGVTLRWRHWTLQSRLALVVGVLAAIALLAANVAGVVLIRGYLLDRIDRQLTGMARPMEFATPPSGGFVARRGFRIGPEQVSYLFAADGTLDTENSSTADPGKPAVPTFEQVRTRAATRLPYTVTSADGTDWRLFALPVGTSGRYVLFGSSLDEVRQTTGKLITIDAGVLLLILGLLGLGAAFVVRVGLRPLTEMEHAAADISGGDLSLRVPGADPHTEPGRLGLALNSMLTRIETEVTARTASEQRLRQFVADASHELRTPLTSIRGFAELYRRGGAPPGPRLDETMSRIEAEAGRMGVLVEDLLMLARMDRQRTLDLRPVDLLEIAADTIRDARARVPERPVLLSGLSDDADTFEPATVLGDDHGLRQVATNLVANALNHTPAGTRVTVRVGHTVAGPADEAAACSGSITFRDGLPLAVLEVEDDGPGVPDEHAARIFERLYRADASRNRGKGGGSGLGLAIVAAIVHGHGGWVELHHTPGGGATFRVLLPSIGDAP
ncbi:histidine kinase [Actinoplanes sp. SE50]|uniref:sensor histidine kinase n=1 Tax=unclassified Actinoplanes TaxID=2626549 RepID=UPI00023ED034|nr:MULTISPECIES: HAMP domain-containing sensor histidine kinase [unclassified Actinoplanes]AEV83826.1 two-component histidine kinase PhoR [Actinoplanes sp. SE50/110]ATO82030.1 histidine kinase [Actinoplanes sp. SE50]SLL99438.1 two-component histidine kinase [Actinoplanes sp. SE50/110]